MKCECEDWKENIDKINTGIIFMGVHGCGGYTGKVFVYCPWCGKKLSEEEGVRG
jgi:hypothetical protein